MEKPYIIKCCDKNCSYKFFSESRTKRLCSNCRIKKREKISFRLICEKCGNHFIWKNRQKKICKSCYKNLNTNKGYSYNFSKISHSIRNKEKKCQCCETDKRLIVHHLDGNKKNDNLNNLITLCVQCHASIHIKYSKSQLHLNSIYKLFPKVLYRGDYGVRLTYA